MTRATEEELVLSWDNDDNDDNDDNEDTDSPPLTMKLDKRESNDTKLSEKDGKRGFTMRT